MSATCSLICFATQRGVAGKVAIWSSARVSCSIASASAERSSDRCPALPHRPSGLFDQPSLGAVTRQEFRLVLGNVSELAFEGFGDAGVKRASRLAQQGAIGRVLHQCVLEQISRVRGTPCRNSKPAAIRRSSGRFEFRLWLAGHGS